MILIAESKTMSTRQEEVDAKQLEMHRPMFDGIANSIMDSLRDHNAGQLSGEAGITARLAASLQLMIYEFPNKWLGLRAIDAFTGVVFRQLRLESYDDAQREFLADNVRIISSLYGWLRPDDIIKPYRFDFKSHVAPGGETLMKFWKKDVTVALVKDLRERDDREIIDLLPADASKCIDWKLVKRFAKVHRVEFKTLTASGDSKTPASGLLKELRGTFLNRLVCGAITNPADIATLESPTFMPDPDGAKYPSDFAFITA